jgi:cobalt-zinc-cadmium efflux system protein
VLLAALVLVLAFMTAEVLVGIVAHSLALITDAGHMVTDAAAIGVGIAASRIAQRPARGAYTYGFARVDAISGQANGITLVLLALWFGVEAVRRLVHPAAVHGGLVSIVAVVGLLVNAAAIMLVARADRANLNIRGVFEHLRTDAAAFLATFLAGVVIIVSGWDRADPVASLLVAALMIWTGLRLIRAAGRVFLDAAPAGVDPDAVGLDLARVDGVAEVHDLHVWQIGPGESALSAHVLVTPPYDCHEVSARMRATLAERYGIGHVTLQADHADTSGHDADHCEDAHGQAHSIPPDGATLG